MSKEVGTYNYVETQESLKRIELLTKRYKKNRIKTPDYIVQMHECLQKLANKRDYIGYLMNIGQINN